MKRKVNPFIVPTIQTYPEQTAIIGILEAHNNRKWLMNNFILLWCYKVIWDKYYWCDFKFGNEKNDKDYCDNLVRDKVYKNFRWLNKTYLIHECENIITQEKYILTCFDIYHIDVWWDGEEERYHSNHPVFVFGFDENKKIFYCADFIRGEYEIYELKFDDFYKAFRGGFLGGDSVINIWKYKETDTDIDIELINNQLVDFIESKDQTRISFLNDNCDELLFGIDALEKISDYYNNEIEGEKIDVRPLHLIKVYVEVMKMRIDTIINSEQHCKIKERLDNNIKTIKKIELMILKKNYDSNNRLNSIIIEKLRECINNTIQITIEIEKKIFGTII